eukprot:scaffold205696_cov17-Tisochrysis_lutea.AAC.1
MGALLCRAVACTEIAGVHPCWVPASAPRGCARFTLWMPGRPAAVTLLLLLNRLDDGSYSSSLPSLLLLLLLLLSRQPLLALPCSARGVTSRCPIAP